MLTVCSFGLKFFIRAFTHSGHSSTLLKESNERDGECVRTRTSCAVGMWQRKNGYDAVWGVCGVDMVGIMEGIKGMAAPTFHTNGWNVRGRSRKCAGDG